MFHDKKRPAAPQTDLFRSIGGFLTDQRLEPNPTNYAFAFRVFSDPAGPLAKAVSALTDGGVRMTRAEVEELGATIAAGAADGASAQGDSEAVQAAQTVVARTQHQVEGFVDMIVAVQQETQGFGRDLAAGADAIRRGMADSGVAGAVLAHLAQVTTAMVERVEQAEARLQQATREASELRSELQAARHDARRDPLTGLPNRRALEEAYSGLADPSMACLAICDVDHFKLINDGFGHSVGDRVLKAIATTLSNECEGHLVARYGGEEFAILFQDADVHTATSLIEASCRAVAERRYRLRETSAVIGSVTLSAGIAVAKAIDSFENLFARADRRLYEAKANGRNRVVGMPA